MYIYCSRHRLSEADEDEELLEAEDDDLESSTITMFTDSPYCECMQMTVKILKIYAILLEIYYVCMRLGSTHRGGSFPLPASWFMKYTCICDCTYSPLPVM